MSEQTAIAVIADVSARLSTQAYNRLYAKNRRGRARGHHLPHALPG